MDSLYHDFSRLLDEGPNHDVEFVVGDQTIKAHKIILCSRSNVFAAMLQSNMVEGETGRVDIQDMDATNFQQFLRYLYTGMLPQLTVDSAFQLYEASDKYGVDAMKQQCADFLTDNLSDENACDILLLSDQHSDTDFKNSVMEYMMKENIPYTGQKWKDFCKENPVLAVEVYSLFCEHIRLK